MRPFIRRADCLPVHPARPTSWDLQRIGAVGLEVLTATTGDTTDELRERLLERGFHEALGTDSFGAALKSRADTGRPRQPPPGNGRGNARHRVQPHTRRARFAESAVMRTPKSPPERLRRSSKSAGRRSPALGRFDSFAAPLREIRLYRLLWRLRPG